MAAGSADAAPGDCPGAARAAELGPDPRRVSRAAEATGAGIEGPPPPSPSLCDGPCPAGCCRSLWRGAGGSSKHGVQVAGSPLGQPLLHKQAAAAAGRQWPFKAAPACMKSECALHLEPACPAWAAAGGACGRRVTAVPRPSALALIYVLSRERTAGAGRSQACTWLEPSGQARSGTGNAGATAQFQPSPLLLLCSQVCMHLQRGSRTRSGLRVSTESRGKTTSRTRAVMPWLLKLGQSSLLRKRTCWCCCCHILPG